MSATTAAVQATPAAPAAQAAPAAPATPAAAARINELITKAAAWGVSAGSLHTTKYAERLAKDAAAAVFNCGEAIAAANAAYGSNQTVQEDAENALDCYLEKAIGAVSTAYRAELDAPGAPLTTEALDYIKALVDDCAGRGVSNVSYLSPHCTTDAVDAAREAATAAAAAVFATPSAIRTAELRVRSASQCHMMESMWDIDSMLDKPVREATQAASDAFLAVPAPAAPAAPAALTLFEAGIMNLGGLVSLEKIPPAGPRPCPGVFLRKVLELLANPTEITSVWGTAGELFHYLPVFYANPLKRVGELLLEVFSQASNQWTVATNSLVYLFAAFCFEHANNAAIDVLIAAEVQRLVEDGHAEEDAVLIAEEKSGKLDIQTYRIELPDDHPWAAKFGKTWVVNGFLDWSLERIEGIRQAMGVSTDHVRNQCPMVKLANQARITASDRLEALREEWAELDMDPANAQRYAQKSRQIVATIQHGSGALPRCAPLAEDELCCAGNAICAGLYEEIPAFRLFETSPPAA